MGLCALIQNFIWSLSLVPRGETQTLGTSPVDRNVFVMLMNEVTQGRPLHGFGMGTGHT